jgi:hypothetical protein
MTTCEWRFSACCTIVVPERGQPTMKKCFNGPSSLLPATATPGGK